MTIEKERLTSLCGRSRAGRQPARQGQHEAERVEGARGEAGCARWEATHQAATAAVATASSRPAGGGEAREPQAARGRRARSSTRCACTTAPRRRHRQRRPRRQALFTRARDLRRRLRGTHRHTRGAPCVAPRTKTRGAPGDHEAAAPAQRAAGKIQRHFLTKIRTEEAARDDRGGSEEGVADDAEAAKDAERHINAGPLKAADEAKRQQRRRRVAPEAAAPGAAPALAEEAGLPEGFTAGGKANAVAAGLAEGERNGEPALPAHQGQRPAPVPAAASRCTSR